MVDMRFLFQLPPVEPKEILAASQRLGVAFPADLVDFLTRINGGSPKDPCFKATRKNGKQVTLELEWLCGIVPGGAARSLERLTMSFYRTDDRLRGRYVILGSADKGHLVLDCRDNRLAVHDLNHSYGLPEDGFNYVIGQPFGAFIDSLTPDPTGEWRPMAPSF